MYSKTLKSFAALIIAVSSHSLIFANQTPQSNRSIEAIRRDYAAINKGTSGYRKVRKKLSGFSLEGGELTAFFRGSQIVKIVALHYGEGGRTLEEYYFRDGNLIFVFEKVSNYDRPLSGKVASAVENRFYYKNDELISWIDESGKPVSVDAEHYSARQNEWLSNSTTFTAAARSNKRVIEAVTP